MCATLSPSDTSAETFRSISTWCRCCRSWCGWSATSACPRSPWRPGTLKSPPSSFASYVGSTAAAGDSAAGPRPSRRSVPRRHRRSARSHLVFGATADGVERPLLDAAARRIGAVDPVLARYAPASFVTCVRRCDALADTDSLRPGVSLVLVGIAALAPRRRRSRATDTGVWIWAAGFALGVVLTSTPRSRRDSCTAAGTSMHRRRRARRRAISPRCSPDTHGSGHPRSSSARVRGRRSRPP